MKMKKTLEEFEKTCEAEYAKARGGKRWKISYDDVGEEEENKEAKAKTEAEAKTKTEAEAQAELEARFISKYGPEIPIRVPPAQLMEMSQEYGHFFIMGLLGKRTVEAKY
jgi:lipocalin